MLTPPNDTAANNTPDLRHDWTREDAQALLDLPFNDLLFKAHSLHRQYFDPNEVQKSTLLSIKTGGCAEDCGYCSQSASAPTGLKATKLMDVDTVLDGARKAKDAGASRYCMGAAWRAPKERDMDTLCDMIKGVRAMGMETCMTLGMLTKEQTDQLQEAGLDYYNHNVDTSESYYPEIITTRTYQDRIDTLKHVRDSGIHICSGGIIGMGETETDRVDMLVTLATLPEHPESVPINMLVAIPGTALENQGRVDPLDFVRIIALARIMMPTSMVRLSAGREEMSDEMQALCFFAGANSVFVGDELLTTSNPGQTKDEALFNNLGITGMAAALRDTKQQ